MILDILPLLLLAAPTASAPAADSVSFIRVNQVGYLPEGRKVAVICSLEPRSFSTFTVVDERGRRAMRPQHAQADRPFGPCASTHRLDFSALRRAGTYRIVAGDISSPPIRISRTAYLGGRTRC